MKLLRYAQLHSYLNDQLRNGLPAPRTYVAHELPCHGDVAGLCACFSAAKFQARV
jgi:hypothetical protein